MNTIVDRVFIKILLMYSTMKNNAKGPEAYSILKSETNSDTPTVRSTGVWLTSARVEINHIVARGQAGTRRHVDSCVYK